MKKAEIVLPHKTYNEATRLQVAVNLNKALMEEHNALEAFVLLKQAEAVLKTAIEIQKEDAIRKMEGKQMDVLGVKVEQKGIREWDYNLDAILAKLEEEKKAIADKIKKRQAFLQGLTNEVADTTTGEISQPAKKVRDGVNIAVTLLK